MPAQAPLPAAQGRVVYPAWMSSSPNHVTLSLPNHHPYVRQLAAGRRPRVKSAPPGYQQTSYSRQIGAVAWANEVGGNRGHDGVSGNRGDDKVVGNRGGAWVSNNRGSDEVGGNRGGYGEGNRAKVSTLCLSQPDLTTGNQGASTRHYGPATRLKSARSDSALIGCLKRRPTSACYSIGAASVGDVRGLSHVTSNLTMDSLLYTPPPPTTPSPCSSRKSRTLRLRPAPTMLLPTAQVRAAPDAETFMSQLSPNKSHVVADDARSTLLLAAAFTCRPPTMMTTRPHSAAGSLASSGSVRSLPESFSKAVASRRQSLITGCQSEVDIRDSGYLDTFADPHNVSTSLMRMRRRKRSSVDTSDGDVPPSPGMFLPSDVTCPECRKILEGFQSERKFWEWFFSLLPGDADVSKHYSPVL